MLSAGYVGGEGRGNGAQDRVHHLCGDDLIAILDQLIIATPSIG